eukprot:gene8527-351_t
MDKKREFSENKIHQISKEDEGIKKRKRSDSLEEIKERDKKLLKKTNEKVQEEKREYTEIEIEMMNRGLPVDFDTTKEKHVEGSDCYGCKIMKVRKWRQFMHKGKRKPTEKEE